MRYVRLESLTYVLNSRSRQLMEPLADVAVVVGELVGRSVEHDLTFIDEDHAVAHRFDFLQDVGREQDGFSLADAADGFADFADLIGVEAGGRLVHDQHVRLVQQDLGHADALPKALRELCRSACRPRC